MIRNIAVIVILIGFAYCQQPKKQAPLVIEEVSLGSGQSLDWPEYLSEWGLFQPPMNRLFPQEGVLPYDLNTPLFTDYASKKRFVKLPEGAVASYEDQEVINFPEGTILVKNFFYKNSQLVNSDDDLLIETRLLVNQRGTWEALTYVWDENQGDAKLEIAGATQSIHLTRPEGQTVLFDYSVPNLVQCKSCHEKNGKMTPIGPTVRQINRSYAYPNGLEVNQIDRWKALGLLEGVPNGVLPKLPVWNDPSTGLLSERARAWLEINCAHCHQAEGPAKNTGLFLDSRETSDYRLGINKPPVAAGRGSAGLKYAIVPGEPESSFLLHRIRSQDPGVMMPELGRKLSHYEGADLIKDWIKSMDVTN